MNIRLKQTENKGAAMVLAVLFFMLISATVVAGVVTPILKQAKISNDLVDSKESYYLAEGALEDATYRIQAGKNVTNGETLVLNGHTTTINVTTTTDGKTINTSSDVDGVIRKAESKLTAGVGATFNYGIQTGTGGFVLNGGSTINGNVYANGSIVATNGVHITGSAVAANSAALSADQINDTPLPPTNNLTFRNSSTNEDFTQSFQVSTQSPINKISLYIKKVSTPSDVTVRIVNDNGGIPGSTDMLSTQGTLSASLVGTSYAWVDVVLPSNPELTVGTTYWIVLDTGGNSSTKYYVIGGNSSYTSGAAKIGKYGGTWNNTSPSGQDAYFKVYLGGLNATIGGDTYVGGVVIGSGGVGDAKAHTVQGASVAGSLYCQTGTYNNKACNTSLADPSAQGLPISDANIDEWKSEATAGGVVSGDYTVGWAGATLGPKEITGDLLVNGGGTLTLSGTVWVHGTITVTGGGKVKLASTYGANSGVLLSDGVISLSGGGSLTGSGTTGSFLMVLTTSNCPYDASCGGSNAMSVSGGAGAVILNAQNGIMSLDGGVSAKAATAYQITASGGTTITYDSGLVDMNFSSGPSGGWSISSWGEVQ